MNYWLIFLTGLTTGGLSCLAVQGGLLAATLATTSEKNHKIHDAIPTLMFLTSKLLTYTALGFLLGYFGSIFQLTNSMRIWFQIIAAILMLGLAANMLDLHPFFRYFVIQPPKWVGRLLRGQAKSPTLFAPLILGMFTVLIPCGVTQAMEVLAISSANPITGSLIMFSFVLGTSPIFLAIGFITTRLSENFRVKFFKVAALLIIFISLSSINAALTLAGSKYTWDNWVWAFKSTFLSKTSQSISQNITITASNAGYSPNKFTVQSGQPATLNIVTKNNFSCTSIFTIPSLGITKNLPPTGAIQITFTPTQPGPLIFTCGMGMFRGVINVI